MYVCKCVWLQQKKKKKKKKNKKKNKKKKGKRCVVSVCEREKVCMLVCM